MSVISNRTFQIVTVEPGGEPGYTFTKLQRVLLQELIQPSKNDFEYVYALQDDFDAVLDLKVNESMYFQPNRDNAKTKAIILRIK